MRRLPSVFRFWRHTLFFYLTLKEMSHKIGFKGFDEFNPIKIGFIPVFGLLKPP